MQIKRRILEATMCVLSYATASDLVQKEADPNAAGSMVSRVISGVIAQVDYVKSFLSSPAQVDMVNPLAPFTQTSRLQAVVVNTRIMSYEDFINFPVFSLFDVLQTLEGIGSAKAFEEMPLEKRTQPFKTETYDGYSIMWRIAYGPKIEKKWHVGAEHQAVTPEELIAGEENRPPADWLNSLFVNQHIQFKRLGYPQKDNYGNTFSLYALEAGEFAFVMSVVRKKQQDYATAVYEFNRRIGKDVKINVEVK